MNIIKDVVKQVVAFDTNGRVLWRECGDFAGLEATVSELTGTSLAEAGRHVTDLMNEITDEMYKEWKNQRQVEMKVDDGLTSIERYYQKHGTKGEF